MKRIPTLRIEAGMVLEKPVAGPNGNILLGKGTVLQAGIANRLQSWGVPFVYVEGESDASDSGSSFQKIDPVKLKENMDEMFSDVSGDYVMELIRREVYKHLVSQGKN